MKLVGRLITPAQAHAFLEARREKCPFMVKTPIRSPKPDDVFATEHFGHFCRVPFPKEGHAVWAFESETAADEFAEEFNGQKVELAPCPNQPMR
jgi:hypothetical protein